MTKAQRFFETFNLAFGRLVAVIIGAAGALLVYIAVEAWGSSGALIPGGIGLALLCLAAAMLYWRATFLGILEVLASGVTSK